MEWASIITAVTTTGRSLFGFYPRIRNFIRMKSHLRALEKEKKSLLDLRDRVIEDVDFSDAQMTQWLREVERMRLEVDSVQAGMTAKDNKIVGKNLRKRYRLSKEIARMLRDVEGLVKEGNIAAKMVGRNYLAKAVEHVAGPSIENQTTASKTLATVMDLLYDDKVKRIGVWGMGGVGKTTLVKNLNNNLKDSSSTLPFGIVIWTTVSQKPDFRKIQIQIAQRLNLDVKVEETEESLANRIYSRLLKEKFLLILDDVWHTIDLDSLGVPQSKAQLGSKIILTSRSYKVCTMMMTDKRVKVDVLNDEESWQLFTENAGEVATSEHIEPIARAIARECSGLPLAIITVGKALRETTRIYSWKDALSELRSSYVPDIEGIETQVFRPLKLSYDSLQGKNIKRCFLYCSLYPEDFSIDAKQLVRCWLGEGLIEERQNYEDFYDRGMALIEKLVDSCLLEYGTHVGTVKMHDVVRDVAIWISSCVEDECKSLVRSGIGLTQISEVEMVESLKRVSFMNNKITKLPDLQSHCPEVLTLLLQGNSLLERISDEFMRVFQSLRVLNIRGTHIQSLPESILQLGDLRVLLLGDCIYLEKLPQLGALSKLQVLDCKATKITELPIGMKNLSNLRQLDLSDTQRLKTIHGGIISSFPCLEVLDMTFSAYIWGVEESGQATFEELGCLERLCFVSISLQDIPSTSLENLAWIVRIRSFRFVIGVKPTDFPPMPHELPGRSLILLNLDLSREQIILFLINANSLHIRGCWNLDKMFENLIRHKLVILPFLQSLSLCALDLKSSSSTSSNETRVQVAQVVLIQNLEALHLHRVKLIKSVSELACHLQVGFYRLKTLEVIQCPQLDHVFSYGIDSMINTGILDVVKIAFCQSLEEVFRVYPAQTFSVVPSLRTVKLEDLPKLNTICNQEDSLRSLEQLEVFNCKGLTKLPLTEQNADTIKEIKGEESWWSNLVWDNNDTKDCLESSFTPNIRTQFHYDEWHWFRSNKNWEEGVRESVYSQFS